MRLTVYNKDIYGNRINIFFQIDIIHKINVIVGNSGVGKSWLVDMVQSIQRGNLLAEYECETEINIAHSIAELQKIANSEIGTIVLCDEFVAAEIRTSRMQGELEKSLNYFIIVTRDTRDIGGVNIEAVHLASRIYNSDGSVTVKCSGMLKKETTSISDCDANKIKYLICEDSTGGRTFWSYLLKDSIKIYPYEFTNSSRPSSGRIAGYIGDLIDCIDDNELILVSLDYDRGASILNMILNKYTDRIDRIRFIPLESFEEIICNSEFILGKFPEMRDYVINYKKYIDYKQRSTGKYFSALLFRMVKERSPLNNGDRNVTKFYEKGMKNLKQCFIDDCCAYNRDQDSCKLYYDSDKKKVILNNKFEAYQKLIK